MPHVAAGSPAGDAAFLAQNKKPGLAFRFARPYCSSTVKPSVVYY
jgi:hypothetical protein